jgi:hypothetical protein
MASEPGGFKAFMQQEVKIKRSYLYLDRFLFLFACFTVTGATLGPGLTANTLVSAIGGATFVCTIGSLKNWYGPLSDRASIAASLVILTVLSVVIWRHEAHKADLNKLYNAGYTTGRPN